MKTRNYKAEYRRFHSKPTQRKNRSLRNQARRALGLVKGDGKHADHKKPLSKGGTNAAGNLRAVKRSTNLRKGKK